MVDTYVVSASGKAIIVKDPQAKLDYVFDWTLWLADIADTIVSQVITVDAGITLFSSGVVGATVVAFISGGTVGTTYRASCKITTTAGRIDERSIFIKIVER